MLADDLELLDLPGDPDRRALVLLHEGLGSVAIWRGLPADLATATGRRVVVFSRHGHGRSPAREPAPHGAFFDEEAHEILPAVLRRAGVGQPPVLVGHSDGATIALVHAAHHEVAGLVLLAPHVTVDPGGIGGITVLREAYASGGLRERLARHHADPDAAFGGWYGRWADPAFHDWSIEAEIETVVAPALLIQGEHDEYASLDQLDRIERRVRGPVRRFVPPGGHSPHLEHPEAVCAAIAAFTADLP